MLVLGLAWLVPVPTAWGAKEVPFLAARANDLANLVPPEARERLETKLERFPNQLERACVELAKDWRTDRYLRRLEAMMAAIMPAGYRFQAEPNAVATAVLGRSTWSVLALICHIELFVLAHYREAIEKDEQLSELWKDVFTFHAREESQHAIIDELEWRREDARLSPGERDQAVDELIALVAAVDGILQMQAKADTDYFVRVAGRAFDRKQVEAIGGTFLYAYRWQYITSGVQDERFGKILGGMITEGQMQRIGAALAPIVG